MAGRGGAVTARVFVSYASKDLTLAREVHGWLVEAGHEVFLDQDPRDGIAVGEQWRARLVERLRWADAVVCVVTSTYLESTWCTAEIATAQERGSRLLPLHAEPGLAHPLLTEVQHSDLTRDPVAARAALLAALRRIDAGGGLGWPDDRCPFPGLRPFDVDWHRVFFGRAEEIKQLAELVRSATEDAVLLVIGPSGCGKSSLVRAGLLPVLASEPGWRTLTPILPGADPVAALTRELAAAARRISQDWTVEHAHHQLDTRGLTALADELLVADPHGPQRRLLVVVDQFEELLTQTPPGQRARFAELLRPALAGPVQVVATLRPEFLNQLLTNTELADLPTRTSTVRPLHREALHLVIEGPARLAGLDVDEHLVARLVGDTDTGEALPLLAFTLAQLADGVSRGEQLSATRYDQLGGVQGALIRQADAALADAIAAGRRSREQVIAGLLRLVTVDEQGRPTRWRVDRAELPDHVVTELNAFVARRLLTTDTDNGTVVIGVAHEKFLSAWPPLAETIAKNVTALRARRAVEHAATEWHDGGRPPARLWGGGQLAAVVADTGARVRASGAPPRREGPTRWLPHRHQELVTDRVDLSPKAREFLHDSIRRDRSRRRRASTVLSVLLVLALVGAGVAVIQQRAAQERQRIATAGQLVAHAEAARDTDPRTALMLGIAAQAIHPTSQTRASLVTTLTTTRYAGTLTDHTGAVSSVAFSADGRTLASASADKTVILWDFTNPSRPTRRGPPLTGHTDTVDSVAFSPDGRILATASFDNTVILWDLTDPARPTQRGPPLTGHTDDVNSVAFSPDGRTLATASDDTKVILWDLTDPARPTQRGLPLPGHSDDVNSVAFSPDGRTLATASDDKAVILWDVTDPNRPARRGSPLAGHIRSVLSVVFSLDGHTLATAGTDKTTILWDVTDPNRPTHRGSPLAGHSDDVNSVAFSPDGHTLATASDDKTVAWWDLTDPTRPARLGPALTDHTRAVLSVAFSPDGHTLATTDRADTVILWDLTDPTRPTRRGSPLLGHTDDVNSAAFSPDGHTLATASDDKTVILWDLTDPTRPGSPLSGHTDNVQSVAFSPDGRTLATASFDETVILWDLTDPNRPTRRGSPLTGHTDGVRSVTFSPDSHILATGNTANTARLWDVSDPRQPHQLGTLTGHRNKVNSVAFSLDGHTLATASDDATVILWDLTDPTRPIRRGSPLPGRTSPVWSVAFSPDGHTLATASDDATVILWDLTDLTQPARLVPPLTGHTDSVRSVAFSPDGHTLATASDDNEVILWDLTGLNHLRDHATEHACSRTGRGLDRAEWARAIPGLAYQDTCRT